MAIAAATGMAAIAAEYPPTTSTYNHASCFAIQTHQPTSQNAATYMSAMAARYTNHFNCWRCVGSASRQRKTRDSADGSASADHARGKQPGEGLSGLTPDDT